VGQFANVGQVINLRTDWQSALTGAGYPPARRLTTCQHGLFGPPKVMKTPALWGRIASGRFPIGLSGESRTLTEAD